MKRNLIIFLDLILVFLSAGCLGPVRNVYYQPSSLITIRDSAETVSFTVNPDTKGIKPKKKKYYHWYGTNRVHRTKGDYAGRLLDGAYMAFNSTGSLIEKGSFDNGLKSGRWVVWTPSGDVSYILKYRNGVAKDTLRPKIPGKKIAKKKENEKK